MKRRNFLKLTAGAGAYLAGITRTAVAQAQGDYPYQSLEEAYSSINFDPKARASFTTVWTSDTHYGIGDPENILPPIIDEVEAMETVPAFFAIIGDLICSASTSFGHVPNDAEKEVARAELRMLKPHIDRLKTRLPVRFALGNHDTHPEEDDPELFHRIFPEHLEYHAFSVNGVQFIFLNGGSSGRLDREQRDWFCRQAARRDGKETTLVIACHQPSLGQVTNERGIAEAFREALSSAQGEIWLVGGHHHNNSDACFRLPETHITQAVITTGSPETWGTEKPGYWIYAFAEGKLAGRIFRRLGQGYRIAAAPPADKLHPIRLPFEGYDGILWNVLVGEGDAPYRVKTDARLCQNYWHYTNQLIYQFPLALAEGKARCLGILETPTGPKPRRYAVSANGEDWLEIGEPQRNAELTRIPIPQGCHDAGKVYILLEQCTVSGFAFMV